jgi:hypothetical protein
MEVAAREAFAAQSQPVMPSRAVASSRRNHGRRRGQRRFDRMANLIAAADAGPVRIVTVRKSQTRCADPNASFGANGARRSTIIHPRLAGIQRLDDLIPVNAGASKEHTVAGMGDPRHPTIDTPLGDCRGWRLRIRCGLCDRVGAGRCSRRLWTGAHGKSDRRPAPLRRV